MHPISSSLTSQIHEFAPMRAALEPKGFSLGGNWDYTNGSFDCALDAANKVWLRIPFEVTIGRLDSESDTDTKIRIGEPYVLKHIYKEGLDREAQPRQFMAMFDQFSDPKEADAEIEPQRMKEAQKKLAEIEAMYPSG